MKLKRPAGRSPNGPLPEVSPIAKPCQPRLGLCGWAGVSSGCDPRAGRRRRRGSRPRRHLRRERWADLGNDGESPRARHRPPRRSRVRGRCRRRARSALGRRPRRSPQRAGHDRGFARRRLCARCVACRGRGEDAARAARSRPCPPRGSDDGCCGGGRLQAPRRRDVARRARRRRAVGTRSRPPRRGRRGGACRPGPAPSRCRSRPRRRRRSIRRARGRGRVRRPPRRRRRSRSSSLRRGGAGGRAAPPASPIPAGSAPAEERGRRARRFPGCRPPSAADRRCRRRPPPQEVVAQAPPSSRTRAGAARGPRGLAPAGADGAREIGDGAAHELPADVEPQHEACVAADLVERRTSSPSAGPPAGVLHELVALEARQGESDGRLREPGHAREVAARHRPVAAHLLEQQLLVERAHQPRAGRPGRRGRRHSLSRG